MDEKYISIIKGTARRVGRDCPISEEARSWVKEWEDYTCALECGYNQLKDELELKKRCFDNELVRNAVRRDNPMRVEVRHDAETLRCPACDKVLPRHSFFCNYCGQRLKIAIVLEDWK